MAKARKKTSRKSTKKKTQTGFVHTNLFRLCLLICMVCFGLIALFRLGIVGSFLFDVVMYLFGSLAYILIVCMILFCIFEILHKKIEIRKRYMCACVLLILAVSLACAIYEFKPNPGNYGLSYLFGHTYDLIFKDMSTVSGLFGAFLLFVFQSLFDYAGTYVIVGLFIILAFILFFYEQLIQKKEEIKQKPRKQKDIVFEADDIHESSFQVIEADPVIERVDPVIEEAAPLEMIEPEQKIQHIVVDERLEYKNYRLPKLNVLEEVQRKSRSNANVVNAKDKGEKLIEILKEFGVNAQLVQVHIGPSVTKFEIKPELGVRVNKISNLQYDIKMALAATDIRIEAPIPGKSAVGIEIPNVEKTSVQMKELMRTIPDSLKSRSLLFCLGKDLLGNSVYGELNKMPHLLIAGATGSGKSVCVNAIICSLLMRTRPDEVKLILIDPKKVEFTPYNDIPHLLSPVITDGELANKALKVVVEMMDKRYDLFGELGVRNITAYNEYVSLNPDSHFKYLPRIVVIIDELADLMLVAGKEVEASIQRITQLARAAGIHLVVATQRPSVDVITGVIKANIPSRIAFAVSQAVDSRTILDQAGAERLLGYGDMLYLPNGETSPRRIQGVFIKDEEVNRICEWIKTQGAPSYDDAFIQLKDLANQGGEVTNVTADPLYDEVKHFVIVSRRASTSLIQRKFSIGYSRAARLMDVLEANGIIGPARGSKPREILVQNTLEDE